MDRGRRPNRLAKILNRWWAIVSSAGVGLGGMATLEVRGRRTDNLISFPVVVADYEGERYLVAMLGEGTNWVANARAAGGARDEASETVCRLDATRIRRVTTGVGGPLEKRRKLVAARARPPAALGPDRHVRSGGPERSCRERSLCATADLVIRCRFAHNDIPLGSGETPS